MADLLESSLVHMSYDTVSDYVNLWIAHSVTQRYPEAIKAVGQPDQIDWLAALSPAEHILTICKLVKKSDISTDETLMEAFKMRFINAASVMAMKDLQVLQSDPAPGLSAFMARVCVYVSQYPVVNGYVAFGCVARLGHIEQLMAVLVDKGIQFSKEWKMTRATQPPTNRVGTKTPSELGYAAFYGVAVAFPAHHKE